jgi:serine/threonine-protein kinase RsbT
MRVLKTESLSLRDQNEIVLARQAARRWAAELGLSLVDQTKIVTATSELARNTVEYGGGGTMTLELLDTETRRGLRIIFEDHGPGIADISLALSDGYTSGNGMGLGLGGSRRLVNEFDIQSRVGEGTRISIVRWK